MSKSVQLPVCTPVFATIPSYASAGMALARNPTAYTQILNQCTSMACGKKFLNGYGSPLNSVQRADLYSFSALERYPVSMRFTYSYIHQCIRNMLDEEFYVYYNCIDDFYLPEKSWYGIRHMMHDGTITGYDDNDRTYTVAAYDMNWIYRAIRIPQDALQKGIDSAFEEKKYGVFNAIRVKNDTFQLNLRMIRDNLKAYLNSDLTRYPVDKPENAVGIVVHDYLSMYMQKLADGSIPHEKMDWRSLRYVWEYKNCMLDRIAAVEEKLSLGKELSGSYRAVVDETNRYRMMYALHHKREKPSILRTIAAGLLRVKEQEREIVSKLVEAMEAREL